MAQGKLDDAVLLLQFSVKLCEVLPERDASAAIFLRRLAVCPCAALVPPRAPGSCAHCACFVAVGGAVSLSSPEQPIACVQHVRGHHWVLGARQQ